MPQSESTEPPASETPHVRGQLLVSRIEFLHRRHGPAPTARVLGRLSGADREALEGLDAERWYPFALLLRVDRAIQDELEREDVEVLEELGAWSARLHTTWLGPDAPLVSVHSFLGRLAEEHHRLLDFGRAEYRRTGFREGELRYSAYPSPDPSYCRSAVGFLRRAAQLLCSAPVSVEETQCQCRGEPACVFRVRWR